MIEFVIPQHPQALLDDREDRYCVSTTSVAASALRSGGNDVKAVRAYVKHTRPVVEESPLQLLQRDLSGEASTFDTLFAVLLHAADSSAAAKASAAQLVIAQSAATRAVVEEYLRSGEFVDDPSSADLPRSVLKASVFLLSWLVTLGERATAQSSTSAGKSSSSAAAPSSSSSSSSSSSFFFFFLNDITQQARKASDHAHTSRRG
jgi:hypothetical protein